MCDIEKNSKIKIQLILIAMLLFLPSLGHTEIDPRGSFNSIVIAYKETAEEWETKIASAATRLFWLLAAIDLAWMAILMLFQRSDMLELLGALIQRILIIGFFLILLQQGTGWAATITDSFRELAANAGGASRIYPSGVMDAGVTVSVSLIDAAKGLANTILTGLIALIILFIYALITAELIIVLVSMYVILNAGIIMLAFGGSRWTQQFAINYYKTVLAIGVKLFIIQLLISLGTSVIGDIIGNLSEKQKFEELFVILGAVLVLYLLVKSIGSLVQSLISGSGDTSTGGTGALIGGAIGLASGGAAVATAAGERAKQGANSMVGAGLAANSAGTLAAKGISDQGGQTSASQAFKAMGGAVAGPAGARAGEALGLGLSKVAGTVTHLAKSGADDYAGRVKGEAGSNMGTMGGRMAQRMQDSDALKKMKAGGGDSNGNYISGVTDKLKE